MFETSFYETYKEKVEALGFFPRPMRNRPDLVRKKEQGRNEKCYCGSGKKYKKCCGV